MAGRFVYNFQGGLITDSPLALGATTANSAAFANLPAIAAPNTMAMVLDPTGVAGTPEIVLITAHTASATSVTITRAQETSTGGSVARAHLVNTIWVVGMTALDFEQLPFRLLTAKGGLVSASAANVASVLAVGTDHEALMALASETTGLKWGPDTQTWAPTVGGVDAGDGTQTAQYLQIGKLVFCHYRFVLGATSAITGAVTITPPVAAVTHSAAGSGVLNDAGVFYDAAVFSVGTTNVQVRAKLASGTYVRNDVLSSTVPFTWATSDEIQVDWTYLAS